MNRRDALIALYAGARVRLDCWSDGHYLRIDHAGDLVNNYGQNADMPSFEYGWEFCLYWRRSEPRRDCETCLFKDETWKNHPCCECKHGHVAKTENQWTSDEVPF